MKRIYKQLAMSLMLLIVVFGLLSGSRALAASTSETVIADGGIRSGDVVTLPEDYFYYSSMYISTRIFASEDAGGLYFLQGKQLSFLDLDTGISTPVYTFPAYKAYIYETDGTLYWANGGTVIVYDLTNNKVERQIEFGDLDSYGIGVDGSGRIYLCVYQDETYYLNLYTAAGVLLDQLDTMLEGPIYEISGFGADGGVYFVGYYNWIYWGYDHEMYAQFGAKVAGNAFVEIDEGYMMSYLGNHCQILYYQHLDNAAVFDGKYLVYKDGIVKDISQGPANVQSLLYISREYDEEHDSNWCDVSSIGVRMVYDPDTGNIIAYTNGRVVQEYDPITGEALRTCNTAHYVFSLLDYGSDLIAVEREADVFYLERFSKDALVPIVTAEIDLNQTDTYSSHTEAEATRRWEAGYISSETPVYASEYSLAPYTAAEYTEEMKQGLLRYSNYLRWLGGLTPFTTADEEVWDNAAKGAVVLTKNSTLTHTPEQPEDMDDAFFEAAYEGCSQSNLSSGGITSPEAAMSRMVGWLNDTSNVSAFELGHRFTFLQRAGVQIAYGSTNRYTAQTVVAYANQENTNGTVTGVDNNDYAYCWPGAGAFPTHAINTAALWSINLNTDLVNLSSVPLTVTITDLETGEVFDRTSSLGTSAYFGSSMGYFYGLCIYFDPPEADSYEGKSYQVTFENLQLPTGQPARITYTVQFFTPEHTYSNSGLCVYCGTKNPDYVDQPVISGLKNVSNGINITWDPVDGAAQYRVFVKTESGWNALTTTKASSCVYTGAVSGETYTFTVRCVNAAGTAYISGYNAAGWTQTYIAQPTVTKLENTASGIRITWGAVAGAERYRVYVRTAGGSWTYLGNTTSTGMTYTDAVSGTQYYFTVRCVNAANTAVTSSYHASGWSQTYIAQPAISKFENVSNGIRLTWNKVSGAERYRVYVKTSSGWKCIGNTTGTNFTYTGAVSGSTYTFTVRCVNDANTAFTSSFNSTGWRQKYIAQPAISKFENVSNGIKLSWNAVNGAERYRVYVKTSSGWKCIGNTTSTSFVYTGAKSGSTYTFTVRCVNDANTAFTSSFNSTGWRQKYIAQPTMTYMQNTSSGIKLTWGAVSGAERYRVYVKTSSGWKCIGTTTGTSFVYTGAKSGETYTFTVRCVNAANNAFISSCNTTGWKIKRT